jgi:hypothetical protein
MEILLLTFQPVLVGLHLVLNGPLWAGFLVKHEVQIPLSERIEIILDSLSISVKCFFANIHYY